MSFLVRQKIGEEEQFYFDGSRLIDGMINVLNGTHELTGYQYVKGVDSQNIELLKYELGAVRMEKQLLSQYTRNNTDGTKNIKNDQQKKLYDDFKRMNTFLASMFLYLYHCFYYDTFPKEALASQALGATEYAKYSNNGIPPAQIIDEIKTVYPYLNNLMMKLLQIKYNTSLDAAIIKTQDVEEQLQDAQLTGIAQVKTKKLPQIKLKTKKN